MKMYFTFLILLTFVCSVAFSQGPIYQWDWFEEADSVGFQVVHDVAVDTSRGWVYTVGGFKNNLSSNYGGRTSNGGKDCFVAKFDTVGNLIWSFNIGGTQDDEFLGIDIDQSDGDIYVVGYGGNNTFSFRGAIGSGLNGFLGNSATGSTDVIMARYNSNGSLLLYARDGGLGVDIGFDISVSNNSRVAYTGVFDSQMEFGGSNMGSNDGKKHTFVLCRYKINGYPSWKTYSKNGNGESGRAITYNNNNFYVTGNYKGHPSFFVEEIPNFFNPSPTPTNYSLITENTSVMNSKIFFGRFNSSNGKMNISGTDSNPWLYPIFSSFPGSNNYAGDIKINGNKLYVGGSVSQFTTFYNSTVSRTYRGNEAFVSVHNLANASCLNLIIESNLSANDSAMVNSIDFNNHYLCAGGSYTGGVDFGGNSQHILTASGSSDGFVAFYESDSIFEEVHNVYGGGTNKVLGVAARGKDVFVCGKFGGSTNLDTDLQMSGQDNLTGFVTLLSHRYCKPSFSYAMSSICSESPQFYPTFIEDSLGIFYETGSTGLILDSLTGEINPFTSTGGVHQIVRTTFEECSDTVNLEIVLGLAPSFTSFPSDTIIYSTSLNCNLSYSYNQPSYNSDCGVDIMIQIDGSGYYSGSTFNVGVTEQTFVLNDGYHVNDTTSFTVIVTDTISPQIFCPQNTTVYSSISDCGVIINFTATASDNCGLDSLYQSGNVSYLVGNLFPVSNMPYNIEFTAVDVNSNVSTCSYTVLVKDTVSPIISNCPTADIVVYAGENDCSEIVDYGNVFATDACGSITESLVGLPTNSNFPIDTTFINYNYTDQYSNSSTCQFNVIVLDTISPIFNCPSDTLIYYTDNNNCSKEIVYSIPTVNDNCSYQITQNYGILSGLSQGIGLNYYLEFQATDSSGNYSTCRVNYEVLDTISPVFINCPSSVVLSADIEICGSVFVYDSIESTDNCTLYFPTGSNYASQIDLTGFSSGSTFPLGATTLSFEQQDLSGNMSTCTFTVQVDNNESSSFNNIIPNGVCVDSDSISLLSTIAGNSTGVFYVNGILNPSNYYTPSSSQGIDSILYVIGNNACQDTIQHTITNHNFIANGGINSISTCNLEVELKAVTIQGATHQWEYSTDAVFFPNDTINSPLITVNSEGEYEFVWRVQIDQCIKMDTVSVYFYQQPLADAGSNMTVEVNEVYLDAISSYGQGIWSIVQSEGIIDDSTLYNTLVSNLNLGLNIFQWKVSNGVCPVDSSVVRIFYNYVNIPNAFSPNGDGVNDIFEIVGFELYSDAEITILDRWGEQVFLSDDVVKFWDGTYKGKDAVEDTYFYILFINGLEFTGYIELRR